MTNIEAHRGSDSLCVNTRGATLRSWNVGGAEIIDGYQNDVEQESLDGFRSAVLVPWSNRLRDGKWKGADGTVYHAPEQPLPELERGLHGLVFNQEFELVENREDAVVLRTHIEPSEAYPGSLQVDVEYAIPATGALNVRISATNTGDVAVPVGLGWHPYFTLDGDFSEHSIDVRGDYVVATDSALIPLPDVAAYEEFDEFDSESGIRDIAIPETWDSAVTGLVADVDGWMSATLRTGSRKVTVRSRLSGEPGQGNFHIFSGKGLAHRELQSIAIEPCQFIPNALNRDDAAAALVLEPGATRKLVVQCTVE